jgi:hypothetical protein
MAAKPKSRPKAAKKITPVTVAIVAAFIMAIGGITASLIQTYGQSASSNAPSAKSLLPSNPSSSAPYRSSSPPRRQPSDPAQGKTMPETEEYGSISFSNYAGPSGVQMHIPAGDVVRVYCRIPGDPSTPSSVGAAGWYKIENSDGTVGYAAANCFYNDPGNGYGMEPNNIAFDRAVPIC